MGQALSEAFAAAKYVFEEVDEALGQHLFRLMRDGPEEELRLTENAQPALMAVSMAIVRALAADGHDITGYATHVAGHSLGEYSALAATSAFSLSDTARLLRQRGQAMQRAVPVGQGAMAAILGLNIDDVMAIAEAAAGNDVCACANDNAPGQVVVSGHKDAVDRACALAKEKGAKRAMPLPVSAPFHCKLMAPAADDMRAALDHSPMSAPSLPVIANVTTEPVQDPVRIKELLVEQITAPVRWRESVLTFQNLGIDAAVEMGSGKVLSGMVKRIDRDVAISALNTPADVEAFAKGL